MSSVIDSNNKQGPLSRVHGGTDAMNVPSFDFSSNSNACGPCPMAQHAISQADASRYPDPKYTALCGKLAAFHGVETWRIVVAASASEFIFRITAAAKLGGAKLVRVPLHSFADYTCAAQAWGMTVCTQGHADMQWHCQPSSPLGKMDGFNSHADYNMASIHVFDLAYAYLNLATGFNPAVGLFDAVWQLYSPNKALGLTGVRGAYAIAPQGSQSVVHRMENLSASWPIGVHGVVMLNQWAEPDVQNWLLQCLPILQTWKMRQIQVLEALGWVCHASETNYFCATPNLPTDVSLDHALKNLREHGIKLRDTQSFGLPNQVRVSVQPPDAQDVLQLAWHALLQNT